MHEDLDAIIESIVDAAQVPSRRRRDELRRELWSHFEEGGLTPEALDDAVARFGDPVCVGVALRRVYRRDYMLFYAVKLGACMAAATMAAILIEAIAGLRLESHTDSWHLSQGFAHAARFGVALTLALVATAEATRAPFTWSRALMSLGGYAMVLTCAVLVNPGSVGALATASLLAMIGVGFARASTAWIARALLTLAAFTVAEYVRHQSMGITFGPLRVIAASAILLMLWASTIAIVTFSDRAFVSAFRTT